MQTSNLESSKNNLMAAFELLVEGDVQDNDVSVDLKTDQANGYKDQPHGEYEVSKLIVTALFNE